MLCHRTHRHPMDTPAPQNEIVVYQPDGDLRLEVRLEAETVWLSQSQMSTLFGCTTRNVGMHLENIYSCGELTPEATRKDFFQVQIEGSRQVRRRIAYYNLDAIISVGYRVNSILGVKFRQWATRVLRDYLLRGYAVSQRLEQLEDKVDRRLAEHDDAIGELREQVGFFVQTALPPVRGVFYDGQLFDAHAFAARLVASAAKSILLIDSWVDVATLELLAKKAPGVTAEVVASPRGNRLAPTDVAAFNAQYGGLAVRTSTRFHDRFLILDDAAVYLFGASLKDLGRKCFAFTQLDPAEIPALKART